MKPFRYREGRYVAFLEDEERLVFARIVADVGLLLGNEPFGLVPQADSEIAPDILSFLENFGHAVVEPEDPAELRLLPNASPEDKEVSEEFRRLTDSELRAQKVGRLRRIWEQLCLPGPEWELTYDELLPTAAALTDVRLVVASRLGIVNEDDAAELHELVDYAGGFIQDDQEIPSGIDVERVWLGMLMEAVAWIQTSLVHLLSRHDPDIDGYEGVVLPIDDADQDELDEEAARWDEEQNPPSTGTEGDSAR